MVGIRWKDWNRIPISRPRKTARRSSSSSSKAWPSTRTAPAVGRSIPPTTASSVDLPDPDGPTTLTELPAATSRSMPRRILTGPAALPRVTWTPCSSIMGGGAELRGGAASDGEDGDEDMAEQMVQMRRVLKLGVAIGLTTLAEAALADDGCRIAVLGDSLTSSYGLALEEGFPARLE